MIGSNRVPLIIQSERAECGLACLAMVMNFHGHDIGIRDLRRRFGIGSLGASMRTLKSIAESFDFIASPVRFDLNELSALKLPAILHWGFDHFVVLEKATAKSITIVNPALGKRNIPLDEASQFITGIALELTPAADFQKVESEVTRPSLLQFIGSLKGLRSSIVQIFILTFALQLFGLLSPLFVQFTVDQAILRQDADLVLILGIGFFLIVLMNQTVTYLRSLILLYLGNRMSLRMGVDLFHKLLHLSQEFFNNRHVGDIVSRFGSLSPIRTFITTGILAVFFDGVLAITTFIVIVNYSLTLTGIVIGFLGFYLLLRAVTFFRLRRLTEESIVSAASEDSLFIETMRGMQTVKTIGAEPNRLNQWTTKYTELIQSASRLQRFNITLSLTHGISFGAENILVVMLGATAILDGSLTIGMLYAYIAYKDQFTSRVRSLVDSFIGYRMLGLHLDRLADITTADPEFGYGEQLAYEEVTGEIQVQDLRFRYGENLPWILDGVNFHAKKGQLIAVVGASGTGKSTLIRLLAKLLVADEGSILVDGNDVGKIDTRDYRRQIGAVLQDDKLFSGTLHENIVAGRDENPELVEKCARMSGIHQEIEALPMKYDTLIGDMGSSLSGGQQQRLFLARALYGNPKILLMDEGTANLNTELRNEIFVNIRSTGISVIASSHDPAIHQVADQVVFTDIRSQQSVNWVNETGAPAPN